MKGETLAPEHLPPRTPDAVAAAMEKLEHGFEEVIASGNFRDYLKAMGTFHEYSYNNIMLIMAQRPDAKHIAGFNTWKLLGRNVMKGEHGIKILTPRFAMQRDEVTGETKEQLVGFGTGTGFDVKQTDGKPLPQPPSPFALQTESDIGRALYRQLSNYAVDCGALSVTRQAAKRLGTANGFYVPRTKQIVVSDGLKIDLAAKTLGHEAVHFTADHKGYDLCEDMETVAESAAFVVLDHFGVDTSDYSFPYVALWAQDPEVFRRNLQAIQKTSHTMITGLEQLQAKPPHTEIVLFTNQLSGAH